MTAIPTNFYPELFPNLNVAELDVIEGAAGPGRRFVIWLQGCLKRCPGCANGAFLPKTIARIFTIEQVLALLEATPDIAGITLSGGEPVLQAAALIPLLEAVRRRGLTVVCYSGYTLEELAETRGDPALAKFLDHLDLLIDGEYRQELARAGIYRPSANQRLHFLSGRISSASCETPIETVFALDNGRAETTGTLPMFIRREIFARLHREGITVKAIS